MVLVSMSAVLTSAAVVQETEDKTTPQQSLNAAIQEGIKLLEAKDYEKFLKRLVKPDDLEKIVKNAGSLDKFVASFGQEKAADVLAALKQIKDTTPTFDTAGKQAKFSLKNPPQLHMKTMTFTRVKNRWCIENH